jgi:hypothetical protein
VDEPGDNIVDDHYCDKNSDNDQDESFTCRQNQFSLESLNVPLPGTGTLHVQCNNGRTHDNKNDKYDQKAFHYTCPGAEALSFPN